MPEILKKVTFKHYLILFIIIVSASAIPGSFGVAFTDSLDHSIFIRSSEHPGKPKKGEYVMFEMQSKLIKNGNPFIASKKVGCIEGDTLTVSEEKKYYCNGEFLGKAKDYSRKGEKLDNFQFNGIIPKGSFFAYGTHKDSFDSKYLGLVEVKNITDFIYPLTDIFTRMF